MSSSEEVLYLALAKPLSKRGWKLKQDVLRTKEDHGEGSEEHMAACMLLGVEALRQVGYCILDGNIVESGCEPSEDSTNIRENKIRSFAEMPEDLYEMSPDNAIQPRLRMSIGSRQRDTQESDRTRQESDVAGKDEAKKEDEERSRRTNRICGEHDKWQSL